MNHLKGADGRFISSLTQCERQKMFTRVTKLYTKDKLSISMVAREVGLTPMQVAHLLRQGGCKIRSNSEGKRLAAARTTRTQRFARTENARHRRRQVREIKALPDSNAEAFLYDLLVQKIPGLVRQKLLGKYNLDLCVDSVVIELSGGRWSGHKCTRDRAEFILESGYHLIEIICDQNNQLGELAVEYTAALIRLFRTLSRGANRQYWKIRGSGKFLSAIEKGS